MSSDSLRDQLLGLGFKPSQKPERAQGRGKPGNSTPGRGVAGVGSDRQADHPQRRKAGAGSAPAKRSQKTRGDIDLAKAYAIRAQREKDERIEAERLKQEEARRRREAKAALTAFVKGKALNDAAAEIARHFPYGGKIKRIYVTAEQLPQLNAGALGVVQIEGRYLLLSAAHLQEAETMFPPAIALKVDPDAPAHDDPYADPKYQVPDDLVW